MCSLCCLQDRDAEASESQPSELHNRIREERDAGAMDQSDRSSRFHDVDEQEMMARNLDTLQQRNKTKQMRKQLLQLELMKLEIQAEILRWAGDVEILGLGFRVWDPNRYLRET